MLKFLEVPLLMQPEGSVWCGPACAGMVKAFLTKEEIPLLQIVLGFSWNIISTGQVGCSVFDVGTWLAKQGVASEVHMRRVSLPGGLIERISNTYLSLGGRIHTRGLTRTRASRELSEGRPVIAHVGVDVLLAEEQALPRSHMVVLVASTHRRVWYLDPSQAEVQVRPWKVFLRASRVAARAAIFFPAIA